MALILTEVYKCDYNTALSIFTSEQRLFWAAKVSGVPFLISEGIGELCVLPVGEGGSSSVGG